MAKEDEETTEETTEETSTEETTPESRSLSQEDINKLIEAARQQEKDKLYGTIGSLKDQMDNLTKQAKADQEAKEKAEKDAKERAEKERQKNMSDDERLAEQFKSFEQRLVESEKREKELQTRLNREKEERELIEYKNELLANADGNLIRELVNGNSKEELKDSLVLAKQKYQDYFDATVANAEGQRRTVDEVGNQLPGPTNADTEEALEDHLRGLNLQIDPNDASNTRVSDDYKKNREKILAQVAAAHRKAQ